MTIIIPQNAGGGGGGGTDDQTASEVPYDNSTSGLVGVNVQSAVDEIVASSASSTLNVVTAPSHYVVDPDDDVILSTRVAVAQIILPGTPTQDKIYYVKDAVGGAGDSLLLLVNGNGNTIRGASSYVVNSNYATTAFLFDGAVWQIINEPSLLGTNFFYGESLSLSTRSGSTAYLNKLSLAFDVPFTSDYYMLLSYDWGLSTTITQIHIRVQLDNTDTLYFNTLTPPKVNSHGSGNYPTTTFHRKFSASTGSHFIDVDFAPSIISSTAYIRNVVLLVWRL